MNNSVHLSEDQTCIEFEKDSSSPATLAKFKKAAEVHSFFAFIQKYQLSDIAIKILQKILKTKK
ncbi:MAG: hypothetical protein HAW63_05170 [Bdellovibrionaceae bacterium]|nr:hypothetical protein [Pseudobdellovibrionaceae bacterium]